MKLGPLTSTRYRKILPLELPESTDSLGNDVRLRRSRVRNAGLAAGGGRLCRPPVLSQKDPRLLRQGWPQNAREGVTRISNHALELASQRGRADGHVRSFLSRGSRSRGQGFPRAARLLIYRPI